MGWSTNRGGLAGRGGGYGEAGRRSPLRKVKLCLKRRQGFSRRPEIQSSPLQPALYASRHEKPHAADTLRFQTRVKCSMGLIELLSTFSLFPPQSGHSVSLLIYFTFILGAPSCQVEISVLVGH